jgi:hypothetical protein
VKVLNASVVHEPLIELFLKMLNWKQMLSPMLWPRCAVYVMGNAMVKGHIMEVKDITRIPDSIAWAAPLSSGVLLTVYDEIVVNGKYTWLVDYDMVRDYM